MRRLLVIGLPTGGMHLAELSGFALGSLMMGWLGPGALAAHQIAITCAATTFMIPLGLSQAVSVRIGQARGAGEERRHSAGFGPSGIWFGFVAGLALAAAALVARVRRRVAHTNSFRRIANSSIVGSQS